MKWTPVFASLIVASAFSATASADQVSSISQYGVTWTFDKTYEAGQFATGDYWVVGPVTVQSVSPAPTGTRNGSAVNPMGKRQGYDDRGGVYATDDNVTFPYVLTVDQSLVSSVSKAEGVTILNVGCLQSQAVLTAVASPLPPGTLRPAYAGTYKRYFDKTQVQWSLLPNLPAPSSKPDGAQLLLEADRPRIDHLSSWTIQDSCAEDNWNNGPGAHPCYGQDVSQFVSDAALYVLLDTPERDDLSLSMIQHGIDNYGVLKAGGNWAPNGGHHSGRKWPVVFAATLLNDCDMLRVGTDYDDTYFGEDGQTYYGATGEPLFGWDCGGGEGSYFQNGCSGAGAKDCRDPAGLVDGCEDYRNCCTSVAWVGEMLSALMLQSKAAWNHDAFFDYVDRWMNGDVSGGGATSSPFITQMWMLYRNNLATGAPVGPTCESDAGGASEAGSATDASAGAGGGGGRDSGAAGSGGGGGAAGAGKNDASVGETSGQGGGADGSAGVANATDTNVDGQSGCGCRVTSKASPSAAWLLPWALALRIIRRRKRK